MKRNLKPSYITSTLHSSALEPYITFALCREFYVRNCICLVFTHFILSRETSRDLASTVTQLLINGPVPKTEFTTSQSSSLSLTFLHRTHSLHSSFHAHCISITWLLHSRKQNFFDAVRHFCVNVFPRREMF